MLFDPDVGFLALTASVLLFVLFPLHAEDAASGTAWNVVPLVGIVTYVTMLQNVCGRGQPGRAVAGIEQPQPAGHLILLVGAVVSVFSGWCRRWSGEAGRRR